MAARLVGGAETAHVFSCPTDGATAITRGAVLYTDDSVAGGGVVRLFTGAAEAITDPAFFVARETVAAAATVVLCTLVSPEQIWEIDTAANTAANQLLKQNDASTSLLVDNTSTSDATVQGVFNALANVGAAADRKALYKIAHLGQVAA